MNNQMSQNNVPQNLNRMESGNLNNSNNFENRQSTQQNDNEQKNLLMKLEKALNNINNSSAKDPRKNKRK